MENTELRTQEELRPEQEQAITVYSDKQAFCEEDGLRSGRQD